MGHQGKSPSGGWSDGDLTNDGHFVRSYLRAQAGGSPSPGPSPGPSSGQCTARGGCHCDCSWASGSTCGHDDGSCCFACCCGGAGPSPPSPPTPGGGGATYCPDPASDFTADYGGPQWSDNGWTIHGGARASSKASYDLAGGFVEFDMDLGGA